jgi:hypothetical protein
MMMDKGKKEGNGTLRPWCYGSAHYGQHEEDEEVVTVLMDTLSGLLRYQYRIKNLLAGTKGVLGLYLSSEGFVGWLVLDNVASIGGRCVLDSVAGHLGYGSHGNLDGSLFQWKPGIINSLFSRQGSCLTLNRLLECLFRGEPKVGGAAYKVSPDILDNRSVEKEVVKSTYVTLEDFLAEFGA